jgi:dihydroxyacid dehydratase/phosphogluconate dehydratase
VGSWKEERRKYDDFYYSNKRGRQAIPQKFALASRFFKGLAHVQLKANEDMVVVRYEGPRGAPGVPEMLDPTSRITTVCREKGITIGLMTDGRFSGGSVGLVVGGPDWSRG